MFADPEVQRNIADFLKANNNPRIIFFDQVRRGKYLKGSQDSHPRTRTKMYS